MTQLPNPETLASLVSEATENMWGVPFTLADGGANRSGITHSRMVKLEVGGAPPLAIVVSSDDAGGTALGGMMFACDDKAVDNSMIDDSLCELANILAGQIKTLMAPNHSLGLPTVPDELPASNVILRIGARPATVYVSIAAA